MRTRIVFPYLGIGARPTHPKDCVFCGDPMAGYLSPEHEYLTFREILPDRNATKAVEEEQERIRREMRSMV